MSRYTRKPPSTFTGRSLHGAHAERCCHPTGSNSRFGHGGRYTRLPAIVSLYAFGRARTQRHTCPRDQRNSWTERFITTRSRGPTWSVYLVSAGSLPHCAHCRHRESSAEAARALVRAPFHRDCRAARIRAPSVATPVCAASPLLFPGPGRVRWAASLRPQKPELASSPGAPPAVPSRA